MPGFDGPYLRVLTPKTSNGVNVLMDDTGRAQYREDHLPLSAREGLEKENKYLPIHLRHKIEEVGAYYPPNQTFAVKATAVPGVTMSTVLEPNEKLGVATEITKPKKIGGRPKGSKNKVKT